MFRISAVYMYRHIISRTIYNYFLLEEDNRLYMKVEVQILSQGPERSLARTLQFIPGLDSGPKPGSQVWTFGLESTVCLIVLKSILIAFYSSILFLMLLVYWKISKNALVTNGPQLNTNISTSIPYERFWFALCL